MIDVPLVRPARDDERAAVANVLDGATLATDDDRLQEAIADDVLVAVEGDQDPDTPPRVLGALVLDDDEITAVAVRRRRRDQGIGTTLVQTATDRRDRLVAEFDADVRPFWASVGFEIEPAAEPDRFRGVR